MDGEGERVRSGSPRSPWRPERQRDGELVRRGRSASPSATVYVKVNWSGVPSTTAKVEATSTPLIVAESPTPRPLCDVSA